MSDASDRLRQREPSCPPSPTALPQPASPPARELPCADPITYAPDIHRAPTAIPPTTPAVVPVAAFLVESEEASASCTSPRIGDSVTVASGAFSETVPLDLLPHADVTLLKRLEVLIENGALAPEVTTVEEIRAVAPVFDFQATWILEQLSAARARVNALAQLRADSLLVCAWPNAEQSVACPGGSVSGPSVIAAGTLTSLISQADADERALALALQALTCEWENAAITVQCPGGDVPNDVAPVALSGRLRRGSVTISEGTITSNVSQADADARAQALADSQLDCFYINVAPPPVACTNGAPLRPSAEVSGQLGYVDRRTATPATVVSVPGNPVSVPAGWAESTTSAAEALEIALAAAEALLVCKWTNAEIDASCPDDVDELGDPVPSVSEGVTIPAGIVESYVSAEDLTNQLAILAASLQTCLYCNKEIAPYCTTTGSLGPSIDKTSGVAAGAYCASRYLDAKLLADSVAGIPDAVKINATSSCRVQSLPVVAVCYQNQATSTGYTKVYKTAGGTSGDIAKLAPGATKVVYLPAGAITLTGSGTVSQATASAGEMALSLLDCYFQSSQITVLCGAAGSVAFDTTDAIASGTGVGYSPRSTGSVTPIVLSAGTIRSNVSLAAANQEAYNLALGQLNCFFDNLRVEALCGDTLAQIEPHMADTSGTLSGTGEGMLDGVAVVSSLAVGHPDKPATILVGTYTSYVSQEEANRFAVTAALSQLNCFYFNNTIHTYNTCGLDPEGIPMILVREGNVRVGQVRSEVSQADADSQAELLAQSLTVCISEDLVGGEDDSGGVGGTASYAFKVVKEDTSSFPRRVRLVPGTVNFITPRIGSGGPEMDTVPAPYIDLPLGAGKIILGLTLTTAGKLTAGNAVISAVLTDPTDESPTRAYQAIATFVTDSSGIVNIEPIVKTALGYRRCNNEHLFWRT